MLAATYGMGGATAGARLNKSKEEGEKLLNNFFIGFPGVKTAIDQSKEFLKMNGYVEDFVGRRRRLSDINLDPYKVQIKNKTIDIANFNPFIECQDRQSLNDPEYIWAQVIEQYIVLSNAYRAAQALTKKYKSIANKQQIENVYEANVEMSSQTFDKLVKFAANPSLVGTWFWDSSKNNTIKKEESKKTKKNSPTYKDKVFELDPQALRKILNSGEYSYYDFNEKQTYTYNLLQEMPEFKSAVNRYLSKYGKSVPSIVPQEPVVLSAWTGKIAQASRQCFNARIQGSAASLTKMAMVDIFRDPLLNEWDAHLIITVHDEVLVECPEKYAELVEKRLPEIMVNAAKKAGDDVPQSCDPYNVTRWYSDTAAATIMDEFKKLQSKGMVREEALAEVIKNHIEVPEAAIIKTIETGCDLEF